MLLAIITVWFRLTMTMITCVLHPFSWCACMVAGKTQHMQPSSNKTSGSFSILLTIQNSALVTGHTLRSAPINNIQILAWIGLSFLCVPPWQARKEDRIPRTSLSPRPRRRKPSGARRRHTPRGAPHRGPRGSRRHRNHRRAAGPPTRLLRAGQAVPIVGGGLGRRGVPGRKQPGRTVGGGSGMARRHSSGCRSKTLMCRHATTGARLHLQLQVPFTETDKMKKKKYNTDTHPFPSESLAWPTRDGRPRLRLRLPPHLACHSLWVAVGQTSPPGSRCLLLTSRPPY